MIDCRKSNGNNCCENTDTSVVVKAAGWSVEIRNDDVHSMLTVTYLLHNVCGLALDDAAAAMLRIHARGSAEVGRFQEQEEAERLAVRLQTYGLRGVVRRTDE